MLALFSGLPHFRRSSASVLYSERKLKNKKKTGEAWEQGYLVLTLYPGSLLCKEEMSYVGMACVAMVMVYKH